MKISILDHGYVELVEHWGSEERIIEAARMSTGKGFKGWGPIKTKCTTCGKTFEEWNRYPQSLRGVGEIAAADAKYGSPFCRTTFDLQHTWEEVPGDEKLLRFLYENAHATPFEMAGAIIEVQAPIFVFREWHRHRTQSFNEMSARYEPLPDVNYIPTVARLMINSKTNKQAGTVKDAEELTREGAEAFIVAIDDCYREAERVYKIALESGVPKELARIHLPVGRYSRMRASANLRNWLAFLTLRQAPKAQWEIREYANAVHDILAEHFPRTLTLFNEKKSR
jgi:thymidylate synthase (FAD)